MPAAPAPASTAAAAARPRYSTAEQTPVLSPGREEARLLKLDLSDLNLPQVNNLHVDGLKASFWSRLFGR